MISLTTMTATSALMHCDTNRVDMQPVADDAEQPKPRRGRRAAVAIAASTAVAACILFIAGSWRPGSRIGGTGASNTTAAVAEASHSPMVR